MKLYSLPLSPYATRVRIAVYLRELPVEVVAPPADWMTSPAWKALSPLGRVPILQLESGGVVAESAVILEYLEDVFHNHPLRPADAEAAAQVRLACTVADHEAQAALQQVLYAMNPQTGLDAERGPALLEALSVALGKLESVLGGGPHAVGDGLSLADCYLMPLRFTLGRVLPMLGRADILAACPKLQGYEAIVHREPALERVYAEMDEGLRVFMESWR